MLCGLCMVVWLGLAGCQSTPAGTRISNINGYACSEAGVNRFETLQFDEQGRVLCTGAACRRASRPAVRIDGGGKTLWPGLIDAHAHLLGLGQARQALALNDAASLSSAVEMVRVWSEARPQDAWIMGRGWNQMRWPEQAFPGKADLDQVVADRPVVLERVDGHAVWVNSEALRIAGIDGNTQAPRGGEILLDSDGEPSGILVDNASELVTRLIPPPSPEQVREAYLLAIREANSVGLTGVHEAGASDADAAVLESMAEAGELTLRVDVMLSDSDAVLAARPAPRRGVGPDVLNIAAVKIYADGALGSRGAALLAPYADRSGNTGLLFMDEATLTARIAGANRLGYQAAVHAIGDRANRVTLNAMETVQQGRPSPLRNRIEHAQVLDPADFGRFASLGVIAAMQPVHATSDMWMAEKRLEPVRLGGAYAWRSLHESGARLAFGSDFPVEPANPFFGLHAAVSRTDRQGDPEGGWRPSERVSLETAFCAFTRDAAWAAHREGETGSLAPGQWADFILLDRNPFDLPAGQIWETKTLETWLAGRRVYQHPR